MGAGLSVQVLNATVFLNLDQKWQYIFQGLLIVAAALIYSQVRAERDGSLDGHSSHPLTTGRDDKGETAGTGGRIARPTLGPRLRAIRLRQAIGLRELARRLDLSPSSISQIETGKIRPSVSTLYALASEFGVTVDELALRRAARARGAPRKSATDAPSVNRAHAQRAACGRRSGDQSQQRGQWERMGFGLTRTSSSSRRSMSPVERPAPTIRSCVTAGTSSASS